MTQIRERIEPDAGLYKGLAKQNLLFHQCISELVDNAIAACPPGEVFRVNIILHQSNPEDPRWITVFVVDNSVGMTYEDLKNALRVGRAPAGESRLNEHGFGLKNALATLTHESGEWTIWSKRRGDTRVNSATGPLAPEINFDNEAQFPLHPFLPADISTLISAKVPLTYLQSVQGRGAPATHLHTLRDWLIEHLGVTYRGYLALDTATGAHSGTIVVSIDNDHKTVHPIDVPLATSKTEYIDIGLGGEIHKLRYTFGTLDETKRDVLLGGKSLKYYYLGIWSTQGIDIRLGKRVIATRQLETIFRTEDGKSQLARHPQYNDFVGELVIPELPRGVLTTVNNKTDFNLDDPEWGEIFAEINRHRPPKAERDATEKELRKKWMKMIKAGSPRDQVSDEVAVWGAGTKIDVYRKTEAGAIIIYELKVNSGAPIHLYQLKMYWDGLLIQGERPSEAYLFCSDFNATLEDMANQINQFSPPVTESNPYSFKIEKLADKGLT